MKIVLKTGIHHFIRFCAFAIIILFGCNPANAQDTIRTGKLNERKIRNFELTKHINGKSDSVFAFMDDIRNTGKHMTEKSGPMAGSKLQIQWLSEHKTGPGTKYKWTGKVVGMKMDFTVVVSKWISGKEKVWGTEGNAKMIVIDWFEMYLLTEPVSETDTRTKLGIYYTKNKSLIGFILGKWYAKWCVKSMLRDTKKHFRKSGTDATQNEKNLHLIIGKNNG